LILTSFALRPLAHAQASAPDSATPPATQTTTQTTTSDQSTLTDQSTAGGESSLKLETYTVNGYSKSLEESLNTKRASNDDIEVITSEDVGKYPDTNLAESLSHLPGVTTDYLFGEGERVSILGTDPNLNRVLLNGEPVSSSDWYVLDNQSRQFNYLLLSPDVINTATVYKSWEPKLLEGSVGGTVDVTTRNPLDLAPLVVAASVTGDYNDRSDHKTASEDLMFSWRNDAKTFGILVGGEDNREYLRRDGVEALSEQNNANFGANGPVTGQPATPFVTDEVVNSAIFEQLRQHQGGNFAVDFKPNDQLTIEFTGMYVKQTMDNVNFSYYVFPGDNWSGANTVSNANVSNGVLDSYSITHGLLVLDDFNRAAQIKTQDYDAKVTYKGDNFDVTTNFGFTRATGGTQHQFFAENLIPINANLSEGISQSSFTVTGVPDARDPTGANVANGGDFPTIGAGNFFGNIASNPEVDDERWVQMDLDIPMKGVLKHFLAGLRFSDHAAGQTGNVVTVPNAGSVSTNLISTLGLTEAPSNFLSGLNGVTPSMAQHLIQNGYGSVANFVANLPAAGNAGATPGESMLQYFNTQPPSSAAVFTSTPTFTLDERINAGYLEGTFADGPLSGNFGARFVETTTTSSSFKIQGTQTSLETNSNTYTNALPAVNVVYDAGNDQLVRFGVSEAIARPNTSAEANYVELFDQTLAGVGGNADLKPYESVNMDLDYEWYFTKDSTVEAELFYRDISNYILNQTGPEQWTDFSQPGDPTETYEITRPTNGGAATAQGVSLSYQQALPMGFGAQVNYTLMHTKSANGPLPFSSRDQVNISPYYENKWGVIRLVYSWRDDYKSNSFNGTQGVFTAPYAEFDANAEIYITKNISLQLAATNLLDETYRQYFKNTNATNLFADAYKTGRTYSVSAHFQY
jgi:iron complex outermembrane receptor protein